VQDPGEHNRIVAEVAERAAREIRERAEVEARRLREERARMSEAFLAEQRQALAELDRATIEHFGSVKAQTERLLLTLRRTIDRAREPLPFEVPPPPEPSPASPPPPAVAAPGPPEVPAEPPPPEPQPPPAPEPEPPPPPEPQPQAQPEPQAPPPEPQADPAPEPEPEPESRERAVAAVPAGEATRPEIPNARDFVPHDPKAITRAAQMAAAGSSREEIARSLRDTLAIHNPEPIVDEAMARYGS
jgi:outer membrane biosynthesis protein TonB